MQLLLVALVGLIALLIVPNTATEYFYNIPSHTFKLKTWTNYKAGIYVQCSNYIKLHVKVFKDGSNLLSEDSIYGGTIQSHGNTTIYIYSSGVYHFRIYPSYLNSTYTMCNVYHTWQSSMSPVFIQEYYFSNLLEHKYKPTVYISQTPQNIPIKYKNTFPYAMSLLAYDVSTNSTTEMRFDQYVQLPPGPKIIIVNHSLRYASYQMTESFTLEQQTFSEPVLPAYWIGTIVGIVVIVCIVVAAIIYYCCIKKPNQEPNQDGAPMQTIQNIYVPDPNISEDIVCVICLENTCNKSLSCNHSFHAHCILEWMERNKQCPVCRAENRSHL